MVDLAVPLTLTDLNRQRLTPVHPGDNYDSVIFDRVDQSLRSFVRGCEQGVSTSDLGLLNGAQSYIDRVHAADPTAPPFPPMFVLYNILESILNLQLATFW